MEKIRDLVDVNTIIGNPVTTPDGTTIIPISKVSFGFASGGSDIPAKVEKEVFGGGAGAGVSIWVSANDKGLARGRYNVAEDGKIEVVKNGWVYVGEKTYYYVDDVALKGAQEIYGNYYYFSTGDGNMKKDGAIIWVPADNDGGVPYGKYIAGEDGVLTLA